MRRDLGRQPCQGPTAGRQDMARKLVIASEATLGKEPWIGITRDCKSFVYMTRRCNCSGKELICLPDRGCKGQGAEKLLQVHRCRR